METLTFRFARSLSVVDLNPDRKSGENGIPMEGNGCGSCNLLSFLQSLQEIHRYRGLRPIRDSLAGMASALFGDEGDIAAARLNRALSAMGVRSYFRILREGRPPAGRTGAMSAPSIHIYQADGRAFNPDPSLDPERDWIVLEPTGAGFPVLDAMVGSAMRHGLQRILIGYLEHASAMDHWSNFVESCNGEPPWGQMAEWMNRIGSGAPGFAMSYPGCTSLQWKENRVLEGLRSRLDLHFRSMDGDSSMMCPENVSGYSLWNDMKAMAHFPAAQRGDMGIRLDSLLLFFDPE